ncbi:hypothetical protein [Gordonia effusa]|nr:hypothetical protein [Gordonia effusa]
MTSDHSSTARQLAFRGRYLERIPLRWKRDLAEDIPLPPFSSPREYDNFLRRLRCQANAQVRTTGSPTAQAVTEMLGNGRDRRDPHDHQIQLTATELAAAFLTHLPAPWTADTLAPALSAAGMSMTRGARGRWIVDGASRFSAHSPNGNSWQVTVFEECTRHRGVIDDDEFVLLLMQQFLAKNQAGPPCPMGWAFAPNELRALIPGAVAVGLKYAADILEPIPATWIRDHALAYAHDPSSLAPEDQAELWQLRSLTIARARDELRVKTVARRGVGAHLAR